MQVLERTDSLGLLTVSILSSSLFFCFVLKKKRKNKIPRNKKRLLFFGAKLLLLFVMHGKKSVLKACAFHSFGSKNRIFLREIDFAFKMMTHFFRNIPTATVQGSLHRRRYESVAWDQTAQNTMNATVMILQFFLFLLPGSSFSPGPTSITIVPTGRPPNPAPTANNFNAAVRPSTSASEGDED